MKTGVSLKFDLLKFNWGYNHAMSMLGNEIVICLFVSHIVQDL